MHRLLSVQPEHLSQLDPQAAVNIFRQLLLAEARRHEIPDASINVSLDVNVPDGGVDGAIDALTDLTEDILPEDGLIQKGACRYQIKTGRNFKPQRKAELEKELFRPNKKISRQNMKPEIQKCLEKYGCYILVCFGQDLTTRQLRKVENDISDLFSKCGFKSARCLVFPQNKLISSVEQYPPLVRKLRGYQGEPFYDIDSWSEHADMKHEFISNEKQMALIGEIHNTLKDPNNVHIRISGEPGIGKTRVVLEALRKDHWAPWVIYTDRARSFLDSAAFKDLLDDKRIRAIIVLDNCNPNLLETFLKQVPKESCRIRSLSIFQEQGTSRGNKQIKVPCLDDTEIEAIIKQYISNPNDLWRLAEFCSGSPLVAHVIGKNLALNQANLLSPLAINNIWEHYLQENQEQNIQRNDTTLAVLHHLALFKRFGFEYPVNEETKAIAELVKEWHPAIGEGDFRKVVADLRQRGILKGERTLHITPHAFHIWLWIGWFELYGAGFDFNQFLNKPNNSLPDWFYEMFRYAGSSDIAKRHINHLVGPNGLFRNKEVICSSNGSQLFVSMTEASPEACLKCLETTIGKWSTEELKKFTEGRQNIVFALEKIVVWEDLFQRGARLLLKLAEAENEFYYSNNASGIFVDLFSPGYGDVSPTVAPPEVRFPILQEATESNSQAQRMLGLKACSKALETLHLSRMAGAEFQGLRKKPDLWKPKTWGDFWLQYERPLKYLIEQISKLDGAERDFAAEIVLNRARGLFNTPSPLPDLCINALKDFLADGILSETRVLEVLEDTLEYDGEGLDSSVRTKLESMRDDLIGSSLSGQLNRFIKLDRPSDQLDSDREKIFNGLAQQALKKPEELLSELSWLVTQEALNGGLFGYHLGIADEKYSLLESIVTAQDAANEENASKDFLGGYVRAMFLHDQEKWESLLDCWASNEIRQKWIPEVTRRSGITDRAADRIFSLIKSGQVSWQTLGLFRYGQIIKQLSENTVIDWLNILSSLKEPHAARIAVELLYAYYERTDEQQTIPLEIGKQILQNSELIDMHIDHNDILGYEWIDINKAFAAQYPDESPAILNFLIQDIAAQGKLTERHDEACYELARLLISSRPMECWKVLEPELNSNEHIRAHLIQQWLSGGILDDEGQGVWPVIPLEELWRWIDEDVEERASIIASIAPKSIEIKGAGLVTRELLIRHGERDDVRGRLMLNFFSGAGWGPASNRYRKIQEQLRKLRSQHEEQVIRSWIDETVDSLEQMIERAEIEEERRD